MTTADAPLAAPRAPRDGALDALRGLAVLGMVFSGSIGFGGALPGWMYHAQLPPPAHRLVPTLAGITWVDLVFPLFLFALGAAIPLALADLPPRRLLLTVLRRFALLLWIAFFTQHFKAWLLGGGTTAQLLSLAAFGLLSVQLVRRVPRRAKALAWLAALALWAHVGFQPTRSDVILLVLAWMALLGSLLWALTRHAPAWRWWALLVVVALLLAPAGTWTRGLTTSPWPWLFQFAFLKHLVVVVPGLVVGDWLLTQRPPAAASPLAAAGPLAAPALPTHDGRVALLAGLLVVLNLTLLYGRHTALNAALTAALLLGGWRLARRGPPLAACAWPLATALLLLALCLEPLQGGIRKDPSTFSYAVVCAGLSVLTLLALAAAKGPLLHWLAAHGRNPLLAYVAGALVVLPLLHLSGLHAAWNALAATSAGAVAKGLSFTAAVSLLTLAAQRFGVVWRA